MLVLGRFPHDRDEPLRTRSTVSLHLGGGKGVLPFPVPAGKTGDRREMTTHRIPPHSTLRSVPARSFDAPMDEQLRNPRLKVTILIDKRLEISCIEVHGVVTAANIRALYVVVRRVSSKLPGHETVIDLTRARVSAAAIAELHECARLSLLSTGIGASETPCRLRILDPPQLIGPAPQPALS